MKNNFTDTLKLTKAKESMIKEREDIFQSNGGIMNLISTYIFNGRDLKSYPEGFEIIKNTTTLDIAKAVRRYFNNELIHKFYLLPEKKNK
jgi:predicted Zn-dependent peptidase